MCNLETITYACQHSSVQKLPCGTVIRSNLPPGVFIGCTGRALQATSKDLPNKNCDSCWAQGILPHQRSNEVGTGSWYGMDYDYGVAAAAGGAGIGDGKETGNLGYTPANTETAFGSHFKGTTSALDATDGSDGVSEDGFSEEDTDMRQDTPAQSALSTTGPKCPNNGGMDVVSSSTTQNAMGPTNAASYTSNKPTINGEEREIYYGMAEASDALDAWEEATGFSPHDAPWPDLDGLLNQTTFPSVNEATTAGETQEKPADYDSETTLSNGDAAKYETKGMEPVAEQILSASAFPTTNLLPALRTTRTPATKAFNRANRKAPLVTNETKPHPTTKPTISTKPTKPTTHVAKRKEFHLNPAPAPQPLDSNDNDSETTLSDNDPEKYRIVETTETSTTSSSKREEDSTNSIVVKGEPCDD